jgi:Putative prokaryotic signal transducing protein
MSDRMVLLAIYGNLVEAELVRAQLEAEGIRAVVMGATSGDLFAGMGVGLSNVQLLVPEGDLQRAGDLLEAGEEDEEFDEDEGSTAIKGESERKEPSTQVRPALESLVRGPAPPPGSAPPESSDLPPEEEMPPEEEDELESRTVTWTADDIATRAWRATLFGFVTFGLLHVVALWLVIRLPWAEGELSPAGSRKAVAALAISLVPGVLCILFCLGVIVQIMASLLR